MTTSLPPIVINKEAIEKNSFSKHDNRHTIQKFGVSLGAGQGKRQLLDPQKNLHRSDKDAFTHDAGEGSQFKYKSTYASGYTHKDMSLTKEATREVFNRFPHQYSSPIDKDSVRPSVKTTWWSNIHHTQKHDLGDSRKSHRHPTDLGVLAATQLPHSKGTVNIIGNTWKY